MILHTEIKYSDSSENKTKFCTAVNSISEQINPFQRQSSV